MTTRHPRERRYKGDCYLPERHDDGEHDLPEPVWSGGIWQMLGRLLLKGMDGWPEAFRLAFLAVVFGGLFVVIWLVTR